MKIKKRIYIFIYLIFLIVISLLNMFSVTDVLDNRLNLKLVSNPLFFLLVDGIIIYFIMKRLKKESYKLQQEVLNYFKGTNNFILFIILLISCSFLVIPINMIINYLLITYLRPLSRNEEEKNALEEYFKDHPEKKYNKFYHSKEEILEDYKSVKKEVETEIPVLDVKIRETRKKKQKKVLSNLIPIFIIMVVFIGTAFTLIEYLKSYSRARYNYFEVEINNQSINIWYEEKYEKVVIPFVYKQSESKVFISNPSIDSLDNYIERQESFTIKLIEYECHNDKKNRVSCGQPNIVEKRKEIIPNNSKLRIVFNNKIVYEGEFIKDLSKYLKENGTYTFEIVNQRDNINNYIKFKLSINELTVND